MSIELILADHSVAERRVVYRRLAENLKTRGCRGSRDAEDLARYLVLSGQLAAARTAVREAVHLLRKTRSFERASLLRFL